MRLALTLLAATALTTPVALADSMLSSMHTTFYVGVDVGASLADSSENLYSWESGDQGVIDNSDSSFFLGAHVGVDFPFGQYFVGAEAGYELMNHSAQSPNQPYGGAQVGQDVDGLATFLLRAGGNVCDDTRLFALGGLAYTRETVRLRDETTHTADTDDVWGDGWAYGVGIDHKLDERWAVRVEYLHVETKSDAHTFLAEETEDYFSHNKFDADLIRIGADYAF